MKINKSIQDFVISELCGSDTIPIIDYLSGKENVSEFKIADDLKLELNIMRNQLYRLQKHNLLTFKRKKDKKKGWYIYFWTPNLSDIPHLYLKIKREELERVQSRLEREKRSTFFSCDNGCMRLSFEQAMEFNFTCPECGEIMNEKDNSKVIEELEKKEELLKKEISDFEKEYFDLLKENSIKKINEKDNKKEEEKSEKIKLKVKNNSENKKSKELTKNKNTKKESKKKDLSSSKKKSSFDKKKKEKTSFKKDKSKKVLKN